MHRQQGQMPVSWGLFPPDQPCTRFLCIQEMEEQKDPRVTYFRISGGLAKAQKGSWRSAGVPSLSQLSTTTAIPSSLHKFTAALLRLSPRIRAALPPRNSKLMFVFILFFSAFHYDESGVGMFYHHLCKHGISLWLALCWIDSVAHVSSRMLLWNIPDAHLVT